MVIDIQLQTQQRITGKKIRQQRGDQLHRGKMRARHPQRAAGVGTLAFAGDFIGDPRQAAGLEQYLLPGRGQRQPPG